MRRCGPVFAKGSVYRVIELEAVEGLRFGGGVGFVVVLRDLIGGGGVGRDEARFVGGEGAAVVAVGLDALDLGGEVGEDADLTGEGVGGVGAFDLGLDAFDGGVIVGVGEVGCLGVDAGTREAQ